jgi:hypothetical protein
VDIDISLLDFLRRDITRQTDDSGSLAVLVLDPPKVGKSGHGVKIAR